MKTTVVITALESELSRSGVPPGFEVLYCGVGKINAALATLEAIITHQPALIVNYGTVGRLHAGVRDLVEIGSVIQRDMMAMPIAERGATPFDRVPTVLKSSSKGILCATGDSFVTAGDPWLVQMAVDVVDMELFAIAHACHRRNVPWRAFKFVTDNADLDSAGHWERYVNRGQSLFWHAILEY